MRYFYRFIAFMSQEFWPGLYVFTVVSSTLVNQLRVQCIYILSEPFVLYFSASDQY